MSFENRKGRGNKTHQDQRLLKEPDPTSFEQAYRGRQRPLRWIKLNTVLISRYVWVELHWKMVGYNLNRSTLSPNAWPRDRRNRPRGHAFKRFVPLKPFNLPPARSRKVLHHFSLSKSPSTSFDNNNIEQISLTLLPTGLVENNRTQALSSPSQRLRIGKGPLWLESQIIRIT